jgi:hypothetical protein
MEKTNRHYALETLQTVALLLMLAVNALAVALPLNGVETGAVSDAYPNLFAPDGTTFAIWSVIYLLLTGHTLYRLGLLRGHAADEALLVKIGPAYILSSLLNAAWMFAWHYGVLWLTMLLMLGILGCLVYIRNAIGTRPMDAAGTVLVRLPFSVYFGWITVATIANAATLLVSLGWNRFGLSETLWFTLILAVGTLIALAVILTKRDAAYAAVILWAFWGILRKRLAAASVLPETVVTVSVCMALVLLALVYTLARRRRTETRRAAV